MSKITVKFYVNNTALFQAKVDAPEKLSVIHELNKSKIKVMLNFYHQMDVK